MSDPRPPTNEPVVLFEERRRAHEKLNPPPKVRSPVAWVEFADNGNIVFWTRDPNRAVMQWGVHAPRYALYAAPPPALREGMETTAEERHTATVLANNVQTCRDDEVESAIQAFQRYADHDFVARFSRDFARLESRLTAGPAEREAVGRYRHIKRGSVYEVVGEAEAQADEPLGDYEVVVVYRNVDDGHLWVRRKTEFYDPTRFERIERGDYLNPSEPPAGGESA